MIKPTYHKARKSPDSSSTIFAALTVSLLVCALPAYAQKAQDMEKYYRNPTSLQGKTVLIPAGSHFEGRLNDTISSHSRQGERFTIEITSPILANSTDVIIPSGSKIIGEVVEAIPSDKQPKMPGGKYHPLGKLRTQINVLQTPDGVSHPLLATIAGEKYQIKGSTVRPNERISNPNMGYVGTDASFNAVNPAFDKKKSYRGGPKVVGRRGFFRDPVLGNEEAYGRRQSGTPLFRSMVKKGRDVYFYEGSPMTVRLDAPLRLGISPGKGKMSIDLGPTQPSFSDTDGNYRRFRPEYEQEREPQEDIVGADREGRSSRRRATAQQEQQEEQAPDPEADMPNFLRKSKSEKFRESLAPKQQQQSQGAPGQQGGGDF
ncbi:MAG: hypothetical protein K2Z81_08260 [Cyanobacteria bacterium]|nr:hypothetical protein [Cyanobacteriota bacterium]